METEDLYVKCKQKLPHESVSWNWKMCIDRMMTKLFNS